jgi:hypothetical protein
VSLDKQIQPPLDEAASSPEKGIFGAIFIAIDNQIELMTSLSLKKYFAKYILKPLGIEISAFIFLEVRSTAYRPWTIGPLMVPWDER